MQRNENRAGISLAMYNDQSTWLEKKGNVGDLLGTARAAERAARRETEKQRRIKAGRAKQEGRDQKLSSKRALTQ